MIRRYGGPGMHGAGGVPLASMGGGAAQSYIRKVLGYGPIAYWPLWEASGTTAQCLVNAAQNGTYSSDVSTWPVAAGIGDGNTAPRFDGTNDYVNIQTAALQAAFPGSEGTVIVWFQVSAVGIWTDGNVHTVFRVVDTTDFQESVLLYKPVNNNWFYYTYSAGGVTENVIPVGIADIAWICAAMTWSASADEMKAYWNGSQTGATQTVLGAWAGTIDLSVIGANNVAPVNQWSGGIAHVQVYDRPLSISDIANLSVV